ncbi:MAG: hypothetical protein K0Q77_70 [Anaerosporomusa subterranea]|jgi:hypothetical protein|nr:hypothetical protein [Anaerosporomusa subterranea]
MAKLVKIYGGEIEKYELTFLGEVFDFSMLPTECGSESDKPTFDSQVADKYPELAEDDKLMQILDRLSNEDDADDILGLLDELGGWED